VKTVLVVANQTMGGAKLLDKIRAENAGGDVRFALVVPRNRPAHGRVIYDEAVRNAAEVRLSLAGQFLTQEGIAIEGEVGDEDPFTAAMDGIAQYEPDEVIVSTLPRTSSGWLRRDLRTWARAVFDWRALIVLVAIAVPWYAAILAKEGRGFVEGFLLRHNIGRFSGPVSGHGGSLLYYFPALALLSLPFTALLVLVAMRIRAIWRDELQTYLLIWFAFVFVFFSFSGTKLPHYLLYGYTGFVILMAVYGYELRAVFWPLAPVLALFAGLLALPHALSYAAAHIGDVFYREVLGAALGRFETGYFVFYGMMCAITLYAMLERVTPVPRKLMALGAAAVLSLATLVVPAAGFAQQSSIKEAALLCRERHLDVVMWRLNAPSFSVYRGAPTPAREPRPGDVVLTKASRLGELPPSLPYDLIYSKRGIVLAKIRA